MAETRRPKRNAGRNSADARAGRLAARPGPIARDGAPGLQPLRLGRGGRDGLLYTPESANGANAAPLVVLLHGAGADAHDVLPILGPHAGAGALVLLLPDSRGETWDVVRGAYGPDVAFLDRSLGYTFERHAIDATHVAVGGFSDGASYALSLGIANGDLFTHVIAFSPGFMAPAAQRGAPRVFISHGTADPVLPVEVCSRRIVPQLERAAYDVRYDEFDGGHTVPPRVARDAVDWFLQSPAPTVP